MIMNATIDILTLPSSSIAKVRKSRETVMTPAKVGFYHDGGLRFVNSIKPEDEMDENPAYYSIFRQ